MLCGTPTKNEMGPCKDRCLQHTNKKPEGIKLANIGDTALGKGTYSPEDLKPGKQPASPIIYQQAPDLSRVARQLIPNLQRWTRHQKETRDLEYHVCSVVADIEVVELVAVEIEVFLEAADIGIADVRLI